MSEQVTETEEFTPHEERNASPIAGCLIFSILLIVFTSLGAFIVYAYHDNKSAMLSISSAEAKPLPSSSIQQEQVEAITRKIRRFSDKVIAGEKAKITVTTAELNTAIAKLPKFEEFREKMHITAISQNTIDAEISFPVKAGLFSENRFLNGKMSLIPVIAQGSLFPKVISISPSNGNPVPEKMVQFLPQALFSSYRTDPDLIAVFHKLSTVELKDDMMIITSNPDHIPMDNVEIPGGQNNILTALSIFGILFFVVFSTSVTIYYFHMKRKKQKLNQE